MRTFFQRNHTTVLAIVFAGVALVASAQDKPPVAPAVKPPEISDVQKLQLRNGLQAMEIAQLKAQAAQRDFEQARLEIAKLIQSLQVDGFDFDLQTMAYVKKPAPKK